jgi:transposase
MTTISKLPNDPIMVGMDLHQNNVVCALVDSTGKRLKEKRLPCDLDKVIQWLSPYKQILGTIAVESTFNWYWLVDGLQEKGFEVVLANPAKIVQYEGIKHADDSNDAFFLADLLRLNILPTGHIYDRNIRPTRDLLRRRLLLVRQRTGLKISLKSLYTRTTGQTLALSKLDKLCGDDAKGLFHNFADQLIAKEQIRLIGELSESVKQIEKALMSKVRTSNQFRRLQAVPGVGKILGLTIALETGPITRFQGPGNYASYCRCVRSQRLSNGKVKGTNNGKNGNKYLAWAWVEAAQFARRYYAPCKKFFDRKSAQCNTTLASKALACKLSKVAWYVMRDGVSFNWEKAFGMRPEKKGKEIERVLKTSNIPKQKAAP